MKDHKHGRLLGHNKKYMRIPAFLLAFVLVFTNTNFTVIAEDGSETMNLDIDEPVGGNPDDGNPDDGNPDDGNPNNGNPDNGNPDNGNPDNGNPDNGNPDNGNPDNGNPDDGNPDDGNPDDGNPDPDPDLADDEEDEETDEDTLDELELEGLVDENGNSLDPLLLDSKLRTKGLLGAGNLLGAQNEDNTEYYLYANGHELSSSSPYDISYEDSVSFTAKVVDGDTEETYISGVSVFYASSVSELTPGSPWNGTPEVGEYYVTFAVPDASVVPSADEANYRIRVTDGIEPTITAYSSNGNEISITASDAGSGILAYSLSTSDSSPDGWTSFENAPIKNADTSAVIQIDSLSSGAYYLYVKDASGNTTRSDSAIAVTWLNVEKFYKDGALTTYSGVTTADSMSLPAPDSRSKFDFAGFYEFEDYSGSAHNAGESVSLVSGQDNVFYGKWILKGVEFEQDLDPSYQKTYDGTDLSLTVSLKNTYDSLSWTWYRADSQDGSYSAVSGGEGGALGLKNADDSGYYKAVATITEEGEQSTAESAIAHVEIQKKDLSVTIEDKTISYLSPVPQYTITATGFVDGDSLESVFGDYSSGLSCVYRNDSEVRSGAGTYPINAGNLSAANYNLTVTSGTLTVTPLAVTENDTVNVTLSEGPFVYTGSPIEPGVTSVGITLSSDPSSGEMILSESDYDVSYQNNINVGTNAKAVITFKGNLSGVYAGTAFEILKGTYPVNTSINHSSWKYGERPADLSVGVDDSKGGTITYYYLAVGGEESFDAADKSGASTTVPVYAGRYYVWAEISETENYGAITAAPAIFEITKRQITLTSATKTWPYDGNPHTSGDYTQSGDGFVEGEGFHSVTVSGSVRTVDESPVTNDIAYVLTTATKEVNYEITLEKGTLSITKASLPTITSLKWGTSPGDLKWVAITRDGLNIKYELQIYKDGAPLGEPILTADTEYNIKDIIIADSIANGIGGYSATITAKIDEDPARMYNNYTEGTESAQIANKYTAKLGLVKNGGDVGVDSLSFTAPVHGESDPDTVAYLLQGESIRANITYVNGYENDDENTVFNYRTGSEGLSKGGYTQGGYYTVSFTNSSISSAVDADVAVKSKDSAPICEQFSAAQADDYSYVRASISIKDALGLYGYKIVSSVDSITDDNWTPIPHDELDVPKKQFTTTQDFTAAGNYYLVFKDSGNNIRYCETPVTVYKLTFDKNDDAAQGTMEPIYKLKDSTVVLPPNAFTKAGFVFTNWTAGSSILPDGASYVKNESATLKAGWTDKKFSYKVNYFHQQFEVSGDDIVLSYPATPDSTAEFSCAYNAEVRYDDAALQQDREGYVLTGTPTLPEGSDEYVPAINVTSDGLELNIYYNLVKYTMTYTYTDYDKSVKTLVDEYYFGQEFVEKEKPARTGYSFIGWNYGDSGQAPVTMPANNLSATGYFKANSASYIIRYYFQSVDYDNATGNYLGSRFELAPSIQGDETIAADYGKEINAYVSSGSDDLGKEIVVARNITGFEPKAVIVSYGTSEAKTFSSLAELNAFADDAAYDSDLTHNVFSQIEGEVPEGVQNGPTIVSFYYTRNTYNLSMHVYLGNRDDNKPLFGATYPGDKASWTFPYGYVFPASGEFSPEWFETYGYNSEGITTYPNGKTHSTAWTKRWSTFETQVTADKYYLANFVDWSSGSRPQSMPAGNVTVVREYASREQSMYRIELYIEKVKEVSHTFGDASYTSFDPGYYELETSFERYIEPGRVVRIVESGEGSETEIPISKLIDSVDSKQYYEHVSVSGEVLEATVLENMYEEDNITIKPESISVLKVYMSRKSYPITISYYERTYGDSGHTDTSLASYTINQKWGTSYFIDSLYYYAGETAAVPTGDNSSNSKASTYIGDVTASSFSEGVKDFETAGYKIATYWYYQAPSGNQDMGSAGGHSDYDQFADRTAAVSKLFNRVRVGTGTGGNASLARVYYLKPVTDKHYYVKLTYRKYENGEPKGDAALIHSEGGVDYQICVANKSDVFVSNAEGAALRSEFEAVNVTYTTSQYEDNPGTQVSGTFYRLKNDTHSTKLLFTVVDDDRFCVGNLASFTYNSTVPAHIGRETFDSSDNNPNERFGTPKRYAHGSEILASTGSANPILGVNGSTADQCVDQLSYYFDFDKDFSITYIFDGKSRRVDYGAIVDVPKSDVGFDRNGDEVFDPGEGYEIVWYTDSTFTSVVNEDIHVNKGIFIYGKRFNKPIENFDIAYYQMPDTTAYYTGNLSDLYTESEDIEIEYQYDEHTIVTKTGTYTRYYNNSSDRVLYAARKSHFVKAFSEFSMDYASYVTEGFEHDDKNTKNVLSGFCGSKSINLRSYYSRTSALLTIRRNDSDTTANDETAIKVNASTIRVDDPVKIGYTFTGWKLYNYTGGVKVSELDLDDYGYIHNDVTEHHAGYAQFSMPICDTLLEAQWDPAEIDFEIVHMFQDNNKVYQQDLLDKARHDESTDIPVVTDAQGLITYYYMNSISDNNLFAAVETLENVKSEDDIAVEDHDLSSSTVSFANGTYQHNAQDSKQLDKQENNKFKAYYDATVIFYYERDSSIVISTKAYCLDSSGDTGLTLSGAGSYYYGQQVNLFAVMQPTGYEFKGWFKVNSGEDLTEEEAADLSNLIAAADSEDSVLTTVSSSTQHAFSTTGSGFYIAVTDAASAIKPTVTITITRDLDHNPLYYNYAPDAENQFNASINWGEGVDAGANNIKKYTWYYCSLEDMSQEDYEALDPEDLNLATMTPIENSNTSTFNLPTGYSAGFYVLRCVADIERKDNGRTEVAQGSYKFAVLPNEAYLETVPLVGQKYTGNTYSYTEKWHYTPGSYSIYYSKEPFTIGEDVSARLALPEGDSGKVYETKPGYKDVIVDDSNAPTPHVVYYYVVSRDANYASITGSETIEILPVPVTVTAVKPFTKIYDGTEQILGKPDGEVGTVTYKYTAEEGIYSDYYRLQSGIESPGAARSPYYKINGILSADTGKTMMLNFDASFDYMHAGGSGREEGTLVTLTNLWVITEDELHSVYENWNYVFPQGETLQLSGQIKPYPLDIKWLPASDSDVDGTYSVDDFSYNYTGSPLAPYIKIVGNTQRIPDSAENFSVAVKNKQTNAGTYSAIPEVEAVEGARYFPTDYTFTLENQTYKILPRYIKVYPKDVTKVYNATNQTMLDSEDEFRFETKETAGGQYSAYDLPATEHYNAIASASYKNAGVYSGIAAKNLSVYTLDEQGRKNVITDNYVIEYGKGTLTIDKCPVVISGITGVNKEYDGTTAADLNIEAANIRLASDGTSPIYAGDSLTLEKIGMPGAFSDEFVANNKVVTISYTDSGSETRGIAFKEEGSYNNYVIDVQGSQPTTTANIIKDGKVNVVVKAGDVEIIYGETVSEAHFEYEIHGLHGDDDINGFEIEEGHPRFMLMKKVGESFVNVRGDGVSFEGTDNLDFIKELDVGTYYIFFVEKTGGEDEGHHFVKGFNSPKYNVSWDYEHPATITILQRPISVTGVSTAQAVTKVYDGTVTVSDENNTLILGEQASHGYYTFGDVADEDESGVLPRDAGKLVLSEIAAEYNDKNVGFATKVMATEAVLGGDAADNYTLVNNEFEVPGVITQKDLTVKVNNQTVIYGSAPAAYDFTIEGAVPADEEVILAGLKDSARTKVNCRYEAVAAPSAGNSHDVGYYAMNVDGTQHYSNPNYNISFPAAGGHVGETFGLLTVTRKDLTYVAKDVFISYGVQNPPTIFDGEFVSTDFVYGDTIKTEKIEGETAKIISDTTGSNIAVYTDEGCSSDAGTWEVSFTSAASSDSLPGEYSVTPNNVASGDGGLYTKNYNIRAAGGTLTIKKFYILVNGVTVGNKAYDGTTAVGAGQIDITTATFKYYVGATPNTQTYEQLPDEFKASFDTADFTAAYASKDVGSNIPVSLQIKIKEGSALESRYMLLTADNKAEAAEFDTAQIFGNDVTQTSATSNIYAKDLLLKPKDFEKTYGQAVSADNVTLVADGFVGEENLANIPGFSKAYTFTPAYTAGSDTGSYTVDIRTSAPGSGVHGNYNISFDTGTMTVKRVRFPAPEEVTWNAGRLSWNPVAQIGNVSPAGYKLVLKKAGEAVHTVDLCDAAEYDFSSIIRLKGSGIYTVDICAVADTENNETYKNVEQFGEVETSATKKAVLVTPKYSDDEVTQKAIDAQADKKLYVTAGDYCDTYVVIAGESLGVSAFYQWKSYGMGDVAYNTGYEIDSFTSSTETGVILTTVLDKSAQGEFNGNAVISDDITATSINLILKLKKRPAQGTLTITSDADSAPYGALTHPAYTAVPVPTENVEYTYSYNWYYMLGYFKYDSTNAGKDTVRTIDEHGNVVVQENDIVWDNNQFTFPRGKRAQAYDVYCEVTATRKDNGESVPLTANKVFTITKPTAGDPSYLILTASSWNYGESRVPATCIPLFGPEMGEVTILYRAKGQGESAWNAAVPTEVGTYEVCARSAGTDSYPSVTSETKEFTINKRTLAAPDNFIMTPDGNGNPYGLLKWDAVNGFRENAGVSQASEVTVTYEVDVLYTRNINGTIDEADVIAREVTSATELDVISYINEDGGYFFRIRALANERTEQQGNNNCNDSAYENINTPLIGAKITTDIEGNTKEYDGAPITITAGYSDSSSNYEFRWYKDGTQITGASEREYQFAEVGESGLYSVEVRSDNTDGKWISSKVIRVSVTPRPITITAASDSKVYDNTPLSHSGTYSDDALRADMYSVAYTGSYSGAAPLVEGEAITGLTFSGTITDAGTQNNTPSAVVIKKGGVIMTGNYVATYMPGTLTVSKKTAKIIAPSDTKVYDGTPLTAPGIGPTVPADKKAVATGLVSGHQLSDLSMTQDSTITDVGQHANSVDLGSVVIIDTNNGSRDVSANYEFTKEDGVLTVTKAPAYIEASDKTVLYDGTAKSVVAAMKGDHDAEIFKNAELRYALESAPDNDSLLLSFIHAGEYRIRITLAESDNHMAAEPVVVTLKINKRALSLKGVTKSKEYDATPHSLQDSEYSVVSGTFAEGDAIDSVDVYNDAVKVKVGETESSHVRDAVIKNAAGAVVSGDYQITYLDGELSFTRRDITITAKDQSKKYDGAALELSGPIDTTGMSDADNDYYVVSAGSLAGSDTVASITVTGSRTECGSSDVVASDAVIRCRDEDVTGCYNISYEKGSVIVNKRNLTVTAADHTKVYDGVALDFAGTYTDSTLYELGGDGLAPGEVSESVVLNGNQLSAGESDLVPSGIVISKEGQDCIGNYDIRYVNGKLNVTPLGLVIRAKEISREYNGEALTYENATLTEKKNMITVEGLLEGDNITGITLTGTITNAGEEALVPDSVRVEKDGEDISSNYDVSYVNGKLQITPKPLTVETVSKESVYGEETQELTYTITEGEEISDGDAEIVLDCDATSSAPAGTYDIVPRCPNGNYLITPVSGTYTVTTRPITITADSANADYVPGIELTRDTFKVTEGTLAQGDEITSVTMTGKQTTVGSSSNVPSDAVIMKDGRNVSTSYDITYADGLLTVGKGTQEIIAGDLVIEYDGSRHTADELEKSLKYTGGGVINVEPSDAGLTTAGEIEVTLVAPENDLYNEVTKKVKLQITKRKITITADSASKTYDGKPLTKESWSITEGTLAAGEKIAENSITVKANNTAGSITAAGEVANKIVGNARIMRGNADVSANYEITYADGKLVIEPVREEGGSSDSGNSGSSSDSGSSSSSSAATTGTTTAAAATNAQSEAAPQDAQTPIKNTDTAADPSDTKSDENGRSDDESDVVEDEEEMAEDIVTSGEEDMLDITRFIVGTKHDDSNTDEILAEEGADEHDLIDCEVVNADIGRMIAELLTEEEQKAVKESADLRFRVQVMRDDKRLTDVVRESIEGVMPSDYKIIGAFDTSLYVKIGGMPERRIEEDYSSVEVQVTIPDELWDESMAGKSMILRTYVDENGQTVTEVAVDKVMSQSFTMSADNYSSYTLASEVAGVKRARDICFIHWLILLMMLLSILAILIHYLRRRKKEEEEGADTSGASKNSGSSENSEDDKRALYLLLILFNVIGAILVLFGHCRYDLPAEILSVVVSVLLEAIMSRRDKKKDDGVNN